MSDGEWQPLTEREGRIEHFQSQKSLARPEG